MHGTLMKLKWRVWELLEWAKTGKGEERKISAKEEEASRRNLKE